MYFGVYYWNQYYFVSLFLTPPGSRSDSPAQNGHESVREGPEYTHEDDYQAGAFLQRQSGRDGFVQPGKDKAVGKPHNNLPAHEMERGKSLFTKDCSIRTGVPARQSDNFCVPFQD